MMAKEEFEVTGLRELSEALKKLPEKIAANALRGMTRSMAARVKNEIIENAPVDTGALRDNIYEKHIRQKSNHLQQTYYVGVRKGKARYKKNKENQNLGRAGKEYETGGDTFYWRFIELGTSKFAARPFIRPAFERQKREAVEGARTYMEKRLHKEARELAKK